MCSQMANRKYVFSLLFLLHLMVNLYFKKNNGDYFLSAGWIIYVWILNDLDRYLRIGNKCTILFK